MASRSTLVALPCCTLLATVMIVAVYRRSLAAALAEISRGRLGTAPAAKNGAEEGGKVADCAPRHAEAAIGDGMVESVLSVWFDGSTEENHRTKWFAQGENVPRVDALIRKNFEKLVFLAEAGKLTETWSKRPRSLVALILVLDQFSRHIFRDYPERDDRVRNCDLQALPLAEALLERGWQHKLTAEQHVFALMPLRHSPSQDRLQRVMGEVGIREQCLQQSGLLLQRFRRATQRRLEGIQDMAEEGAEILEHFEFEPPDRSLMDRHQLVRVLRTFLDERGFVARQAHAVVRGLSEPTHAKGGRHDSEGRNSDSIAVTNGDGESRRLRTVAVSLSGGVDSMALCEALVHLKPVYGFEVMGIHMDYGNRRESGREADFVEDWCARRGVVFHKRAIAEVRRGVTAREEYEKVAREIRFNTYKAALAGRDCQAVMFGHHEGDVEENVLTNLVKGCSILELAGMLPENTVNGVRVWRPMLPFGKDVIFDFAHKFGVPYFKDTTPSWSTRGKLRRQLIPTMEEVFGSGGLSHLSAVARESDDLRGLVHQEVFRPVWERAVMQPLGMRLEVESLRKHGLLFWKELLRALVHSMGMPMVRDKTLTMFVKDFLQKDIETPLPDKWVELRKEYVGLLHSGFLYIFRMGVFLPANTSYGEQAEGKPVPLDGGLVRVGPWRITTVEGKSLTRQDCENFERGRPPAVETPPFNSLEEFMEGEITYAVAVPDTPDPTLTVQPGEKAKVPAWKDIDSRIRRALPLVAPPRSRDPVLLSETGARMVMVTLKYLGGKQPAEGIA